MDQVRTALTWLKKHHFWVLCGVVALIGIFCWWSASKTFSAKYDTNQKTITSEFGNLKQVRDATFHPNQAIIEKQTEEKKKESESVLKIWQQLYDRQRAQVLQWPTALSKSFRDAVEKLQFNDEIPSELRNNYQNYIERHFPELPKQISARMIEPNAANNMGGGRYGGDGFNPGGVPGTVPEEEDYICDWLDQGVVREQLKFPEQPSSLRIWVTQEDLWVYHTLLDVIAKTNQAAATRKANAAVKTVFFLEVGQRASLSSRQPNRLLVRPPAAAAPAEGTGPPMAPGAGGAGRMMPPSGPSERRGGPSGGGGVAMSPAQEQAFLLSGRYLDDKGPVIVGGAAAGAEGGPPAPAPAADAGPAPPLDQSLFGVGYKRLPVRMVLQMDVRWLPQLITACANEPLRVEVQEVRVNTPDIIGLDGSSSAGGGRSGGFGEGGSRGGGSSGSNLFPDHNGVQVFPANPNVVNVVIQGVIYIFNKPNTTLLQGSADGKVAGS